MFIFMCLVFVGCNGISGISESATEFETQEELVVNMTDEEVDFLCNKYVDEQRIKAGKLYAYQEEALLQYRFAKEYLESKYPGVKFTYFHLSAIAETSNKVGEVEFYAGDDEENCYSVKITDENNTYRAVDDYANHRLGEIYSDKVRDNLSKNLEFDFLVYTTINGFFDETVNGKETGEDIFAFENQKDVYVYVDMEANESKCEDAGTVIEQYFRDEKQYMSCTIWFADGISKKCQTLEECRKYISSLDEEQRYKISFNTF